MKRSTAISCPASRTIWQGKSRPSARMPETPVVTGMRTRSFRGTLRLLNSVTWPGLLHQVCGPPTTFYRSSLPVRSTPRSSVRRRSALCRLFSSLVPFQA